MPYLFIIFLAWISFFPEPVQGHYLIFVRLFLGTLLIISIIRKGPRSRLIFTKGDAALWIFSLSMLGGVFFAENLKIAVRQYLDLFIPLFLLYYLVKSEFIFKNRWFIAKSICFFSALVALCGILEWTFHKNPIYEYFVPNAYYRVFLGRRAMSTQYHPAVLGSYLMVCLPFSFLLMRRKILSDRFLGILCLSLGLSGIILAFSRGSLFGVIALCCVWFLQKKRTLLFKYFVISLLLIISVCSLSSLSRNFSPFQRFSIKGLLDKGVFQARTVRTITAYRMLRKHPLFGIGLCHFRKNYNKYSPVPRSDEDGKVPDNMFLLFLAEAGITGFLGFIFFIGYLLKKAFHRIKMLKDGENKDMLIAVTAGLVGLLVNMNTYDMLYWVTPLFLFGILAGMVSAHCDV